MDKILLFSYVPLLYGPPILPQDSDLLKVYKQIDSSLVVHACLWAGGGKKNECIFLINDAAIIHQHLMAWSENQPVKWFQLEITSNPDSYYAIALFPKFNLSIERHKISFQLQTGYPVPKKSEYNIITKPISFVSHGPSKIFKKVKNRISKGVEVRLMDISDYRETQPNEKLEDYCKFVEGKSLVIGKFKPTKGNGFTKDMLQGRLLEISKDAS